MSKGRIPDYKLACMNKVTGQKSNGIGAAWKNDNGSLSIVLDPGTCLMGDPNMVITLFPYDGAKKPWTPPSHIQSAPVGESEYKASKALSPAPTALSNQQVSEPLPTRKRTPKYKSGQPVGDNDVPF